MVGIVDGNTTFTNNLYVSGNAEFKNIQVLEETTFNKITCLSSTIFEENINVSGNINTNNICFNNNILSVDQFNNLIYNNKIIQLSLKDDQRQIYIGSDQYLSSKISAITFTDMQSAIEYIRSNQIDKNKLWTIIVQPNYIITIPKLQNLNIKIITDGILKNQQISGIYNFPYIISGLNQETGEAEIYEQSILTGEARVINTLICQNSNIECIGIHFGSTNMYNNNDRYITLNQNIDIITGYIPSENRITAYIAQNPGVTIQQAKNILIKEYREAQISEDQINWAREQYNLPASDTDETVKEQILSHWPTPYYIEQLTNQYNNHFLTSLTHGKINISNNSKCTLNHCRFYGSACDGYNIAAVNNSIVNIINCYCSLTNEITGRLPDEQFTKALYTQSNSIININTNQTNCYTVFDLKKFMNNNDNTALTIIKQSNMNINSNIYLSGFTSGISIADTSVLYSQQNIYYNDQNTKVLNHIKNGYDDISNNMAGFISCKNTPVLSTLI